jgi:transcriptional regulator with GAF, ATPase, and Fis domain
MTIGFCLAPVEAAAMAAADVDILCLDLGFAEAPRLEPSEHQAALDRAMNRLDEMIAAAEAVRPGCFPVVCGGPVVLPQDTTQIYQRTSVLGYIGGSAIERFPAAAVVTQTVRDFRHASTASRRDQRLGGLTGASAVMHELFETIRRVARSEATVLIQGESGTGKELAARAIHELSRRRTEPLVTWNCGATTESLAMSELFGHEKGAFTGAMRTHVGKFEAAAGGTLFMDEVAELPASVQASLLRVLQEREIVRVGGEKTFGVDVRLIAASNRDFRERVVDGRFRLDLYYRLSPVVLRMPPLRDRREDIPLLVWEMVQEFSRQYGTAVPRIPDAAMAVLTSHSWPGNIRELRNVIERCFILGPTESFARHRLEELFAGDRSMAIALEKHNGPEVPAAMKRHRLPEVLARHSGNKTAAARELGITRKTLYDWLRAQA